jgi:valyl-tRNA synthetase
VAVQDEAAARAEIDWLVRLISEVRGVRSEMNVPPSVTVPLLVQDATPETLARGARWIDAIRRLARAWPRRDRLPQIEGCSLRSQRCTRPRWCGSEASDDDLLGAGEP